MERHALHNRMDKNRIYLVRHGENYANLTKEFSYRKVDYSLTPKGRLQAEQTAQVFVEKDIAAIYSSPLKRALETAAIIAERLKIRYKIVENFREVNVGALEGRPANVESWDLHNQVIEDWFAGRSERSFPGGENHISLCKRMRRGIEQIVRDHPNQNLVVVSHGGLFAFTLSDLCPQIDLGWFRKQENHNCSISEILVEWKNGKLNGQLVAWAQYNHLHGEAAKLVSGTPEKDFFQDKPDAPGRSGQNVS